MSRPVVHAAALGQGDDRDGVGQALGCEGRAIDRVDRHVDLRGHAVADQLAAVEHRRLVLLAFADDDHAVHVDVGEGVAHGLDGGVVGAETWLQESDCC